MKKDFVIRILFIEHSVEEAEQIISMLRNTGIAVRPARATSGAQVQAALNELEPDMVMFDPANGARGDAHARRPWQRLLPARPGRLGG